MRRTVLVLLLAGLVLAPAAAAKGPHAILSSGPQTVEAGKPWIATVVFVEYGPAAKLPLLTARNGTDRVAVGAKRSGSVYRFAVRFPREGRWWAVTVHDGTPRGRRFVFPAVTVGRAQAQVDYVAFPKGSTAERRGAGGPYAAAPEPAGSDRDTPPSPKPISLAVPSGDGAGGRSPWVFAVPGLVLAGAGLFTWGRRRARPAP